MKHLNEFFFKDKYQKYKNKVAKYLKARGIDALSLGNQFEEYCKDFFLDDFPAEFCAKSCAEHVKMEESQRITAAKKFLREHGFRVRHKVINEEAIGNGKTKLGEICKKYTQDGYFEKLINSGTLLDAKKIFMAEIKPYVGHGISAKYFNKILERVKKANNAFSLMKIASDTWLFIIGDGVI